ncbi:MAG: YbhB/YbcL family Raf kinase inhibitor-like protein, partial [Candidatus Poseidoniia archaeon]|nr:YbhB/YbcL family Raf kinase inhibitor-like protein [Candidatus Poseidoniia archaeon]
SSVPDEAKSLVLIMEDPDVPKSIREDGMWDHWVVFNIPATVKKIEKDSVPEGVLGVNTKGENKYGGPCPPDREHRYFFRLFALESELGLEEGATKAQVEEAIEGHVIEVAQLIGRYERNN